MLNNRDDNPTLISHDVYLLVTAAFVSKSKMDKQLNPFEMVLHEIVSQVEVYVDMSVYIM